MDRSAWNNLRSSQAVYEKKKPFQSKLKLFRNASLRPPASHRLRKGQNHQRQAELVSAASTGRSRLSGHGSDWCERCQVERRRTRGDSSAGTGAPAAEPLDICFTISLCCKTEQEGGRGGREKKKITPRSYFPHSGELQAAQLHYTCTEQSARRRFTKTTKYLVTYRLTCAAE